MMPPGTGRKVGTQLRRPDGIWLRADGGDGGYALIDQGALDTTTVTMYHTYYNQNTAKGFARVTNVASCNTLVGAAVLAVGGGAEEVVGRVRLNGAF